MGIPKQLLNWNNTTLLGNTIEVAQKLQSTIFVVLGANFEKIKDSIDHFPVNILKNENWKKGLGNSIAFGVKHILENQYNVDAILILLADQPLVNTKYLDSLIATYKIEKSQIIASRYKNGKQGVPVLFDKVYFEELSKLNDDNGAKTVLQKHSEHVFAIHAESIVLDINTQNEYQKLYDDAVLNK